MSKRLEARTAIKNALINKTKCEDRVYLNRFTKWRPELFPAMSIYCENESAEIYNVAPRKYKRTANIAIEVVDYAYDNLDETIDELTDKIETILHQDHYLYGVVSDFIFVGVEIGTGNDGEDQFYSAKMNYDVVYYSDHVIPQSELSNLNEIRNTIINDGNDSMQSIHHFEDETEGDSNAEESP